MRTTDLPGQLLRVTCGLQSRVTELRRRGQRGDVPGWVLVTLMSALLVAVLYGLAKTAFSNLFNQAMNVLTGT